MSDDQFFCLFFLIAMFYHVRYTNKLTSVEKLPAVGLYTESCRLITGLAKCKIYGKTNYLRLDKTMKTNTTNEFNHVRSHVNPFTPDSAKSKIDKSPKITNWGKLNNMTTVKYCSTAFQ